MIKKIKKWIATNRKLRDEKKEREFKGSLNKEYLMRSMFNALIPQDWEIEIKYYTIDNNNFIEIYNFEALKRFVEEGGIILYKDDEQLYKKVKYLKKKNIDYLLIQDKSELGYNNKNMNIFDSESEYDLYGEPEIECKEFVKNGGLIIYLNDKNLDKKIEILDEKGIPFMLVSEERYLEFNNENRRIDWQKEL